LLIVQTGENGIKVAMIYICGLGCIIRTAAMADGVLHAPDEVLGEESDALQHRLAEIMVQGLNTAKMIGTESMKNTAVCRQFQEMILSQPFSTSQAWTLNELVKVDLKSRKDIEWYLQNLFLSVKNTNAIWFLYSHFAQTEIHVMKPLTNPINLTIDEPSKQFAIDILSRNSGANKLTVPGVLYPTYASLYHWLLQNTIIEPKTWETYDEQFWLGYMMLSAGEMRSEQDVAYKILYPDRKRTYKPELERWYTWKNLPLAFRKYMVERLGRNMYIEDKRRTRFLDMVDSKTYLLKD
jgi:hypothetical protein